MTKLKITTLALLVPASLSLISCDSDSNDEKDAPAIINPTSNVLPLTLEAGNKITLTFSGGDSAIIGDIVSSSIVRYSFRFGSDTIDLGSVPYSYTTSTGTRLFESQPNTLNDQASIVAINNTIAANSSLQNLLATPNLTASQKRTVTALVNQNTQGVTISFDDDFFLVENANLATTGETGATGTFTETGSTIQFSSNSVSLTGSETNYAESVSITFQ